MLGAAVGINMTFLYPYSLLAKGWGKEHRKLARWDLGMTRFLPFSVVTSLIIVAMTVTNVYTGEDVVQTAGRSFYLLFRFDGDVRRRDFRAYGRVRLYSLRDDWRQNDAEAFPTLCPNSVRRRFGRRRQSTLVVPGVGVRCLLHDASDRVFDLLPPEQ